MRTYQNHLADAGEQELPLYGCRTCRKTVRAFQLVCVSDSPAFEGDWVCTCCLRAAELVVAGIAEALARPLRDAWDQEGGADQRAHRDQLADRHRWTVAPDSPLASDCRAAFDAYLAALHRISLDFERPSLVVWPDVPALDYEPAPAG